MCQNNPQKNTLNNIFNWNIPFENQINCDPNSPITQLSIILNTNNF